MRALILALHGVRLTVGAGILSMPLVIQAAPAWDCRQGAQGWTCSADAGAVEAPPVTEAQVRTPPPVVPVDTSEPVVQTAPPQAEPVPVAPPPQQRPQLVPAPMPVAAPPAMPDPADAREVVAPSAVRFAPSAPVPATVPAPTLGASTAPPAGGGPEKPDTPPTIRPSGVATIWPDDADNWTACAARMPRELRLPDADRAAGAPVVVEADSLLSTQQPPGIEFSGDVDLTRADERIQAAQMSYERDDNRIRAQGDVRVSRPEVEFRGTEAVYDLGDRRGSIQQVQYRLPGTPVHGAAESAQFSADGQSSYAQLSYTTCPGDDPSWLLTARTMDLDRVEGLGAAQDVKLNFHGVPVLYLPSLSFPIDDRRRSGVLPPSVGYSGNTGFELGVPYYLNLASNYDLTLTPRVMSQRGVMLGGEFRYLTSTSEGALAAEFLPSDRGYPGGDARGQASLRDHSRFSDRVETNVRAYYASDTNYLDEFGGSLGATSTRQLERTAEAWYHGDDWDLLARAQGFQTLHVTPGALRPYQRLPQVRFDLDRDAGPYGLNYQLGAEIVHFADPSRVSGQRLDLTPSIGLPLRNSWAYLEPRVGVRYTGYQLKGQALGLPDDPDRLSTLVTLDGGMFFERSTSYFGLGATQTLEPRVYYLYVPHENQGALPVFDTTALDFNFANLFRTNRYSGADRVGDANQVTAAVTTRYLSEQSGRELLRASLGHISYFEDRRVTLPGEVVDTDAGSAVVGELGAALTPQWGWRAGLQWDPYATGNEIDQALSQITYRGDGNRQLSAAYRYRRGNTEHADLAGVWPLSETTSLIGRWDYSLRDNRLLEALAGFEYGRCCWRLRLLTRQYVDATNNARNFALLLQLELNGLGKLGKNMDNYLESGVYGYGSDDEY